MPLLVRKYTSFPIYYVIVSIVSILYRIGINIWKAKISYKWCDVEFQGKDVYFERERKLETEKDMILHVVYEKSRHDFITNDSAFLSVSPSQIRKFLQFGITKAESSARGGLENKNMGKDFLIPSFFIYTEPKTFGKLRQLAPSFGIILACLKNSAKKIFFLGIKLFCFSR